eukprot:3929167-Rhodomonas_salina.9
MCWHSQIVDSSAAEIPLRNASFRFHSTSARLDTYFDVHGSSALYDVTFTASGASPALISDTSFMSSVSDT